VIKFQSDNPNTDKTTKDFLHGHHFIDGDHAKISLIKVLLQELNSIIERCERANSHISNIADYYVQVQNVLNQFKIAVRDVEDQFAINEASASSQNQTQLQNVVKFANELECEFQQRYNKQYANNEEFDMLLTSNPSQKNLEIIDKYHTCDNSIRKSQAITRIQDKYQEYLNKTDQSQQSPKKTRKTNAKRYVICKEKEGLDFEFFGTLSPERQNQCHTNDIKAYLDSCDLDMDETVVDYWRRQTNSSLKTFMKQFIQVPSSNAAVERVWSVAKEILSEKRYSMKKETLEGLIFIQCSQDLVDQVY
jgi:hypothetical protein